jgi:hypothetical protein
MVVGFPDLSSDEESAFRSLHGILASLEVTGEFSHARQEALKKRRRRLFKLFWAFGIAGEGRFEVMQPGWTRFAAERRSDTSQGGICVSWLSRPPSTGHIPQQ